MVIEVADHKREAGAFTLVVAALRCEINGQYVRDRHVLGCAIVDCNVTCRGYNVPMTQRHARVESPQARSRVL